MRKLALTTLTLGALAVIGFAIPMTSPAAAATVVIKKGDRGHHYGWDRGHHYGWRGHDRHQTVIIRRGNHDYGRKTVIIRRGERD
jgi:hypothetical protein